MEKINLTWGLLGITLTSFIIVLARYPGEIFFSSRCSGCQRRLRWNELVPFFSYFFLKGRCKSCAHPIGWWMPILELMGGILGALAPLHSSPILWASLALLLIGITACDLEHGHIPPAFLGVLLALGLGYFYNAPYHWLSPLLLAGGLLSIYFLYQRYYGYIPIGMGDIKLLIILGVWIDPFHLPWFLVSLGLCGVLFGTLWKTKNPDPHFPFAPSIMVTFLVFFWKGL